MQSLIAVVPLLILMLAVASATYAGQLWGGDTEPGGYLYTIDAQSGLKVIRSLSRDLGIVRINGLTYNSRDHHLYATSLAELGTGRTPLRNLYRISLDDLSVTASPIDGITWGSSQVIDSIEYDSRRNVFWGSIPQSQELITIDPVTMQAKVIGKYSRASIISGLAYDERNDILYGVDDVQPVGAGGLSRLVTIDLKSAEVTDVGPPGLGLGLDDLDSLAFDPIGRVLYSIQDGFDFTKSQRLVAIEPMTGIAKFISTRASVTRYYQGLAFVVPEPDSDGVFLLSAIVLMGVARSRLWSHRHSEGVYCCL